MFVLNKVFRNPNLMVTLCLSIGLCATTRHNENKVDNFYQQLQELIEQIPMKDILILQVHMDA